MATVPASLVTPERLLFEEDVQAVFLRTDAGDAAFMPAHTPLVGAIVPGLVRFQREDGSEERAAVHGGFVQVEGSRVVVLAPVAELQSAIDVERARRALDSARTKVAELEASRSGVTADGGHSPVEQELAEAEAAVVRGEVRLEVAGVAPEVRVDA